MNDTPQIIVYRSPGEAAIWDWIINGSGGYVIVWALCAFVVAIVLFYLEDRIIRLENARNFMVTRRRFRVRYHPRHYLGSWTAPVVAIVCVIVTHLLFRGVIWALAYL